MFIKVSLSFPERKRPVLGQKRRRGKRKRSTNVPLEAAMAPFRDETTCRSDAAVW
jgi:hypothetical protein